MSQMLQVPGVTVPPLPPKTSVRLARYAWDPASFIDDHVRQSEHGKPFRLAPHQREVLRLAFRLRPDGNFANETVIWSEPKKSGKTAMAAALVLWYAYTQDAPNEIIVVANDLEQAIGRVFKTLVGMVESNPTLRASARVLRSEVHLSNGTKIRAIPSDYAGEAGANHGMTSWDELWAFTSERGIRLWDELTPVPTRRRSLRLVTTYAGFEGESQLLYEHYLASVGSDEHRDGKGRRVSQDLPCWENDGRRIFCYWSHEPRMPWQTDEYYVNQAAELRPVAFTRLHRNRWTSGASVFLTAELWDACVDPDLLPVLDDRSLVVFAGADASTKRDTTSVVAVARVPGTDRIRLVDHRIWQPTPEDPMDLENTVQAYVVELSRRFTLERLLFDPTQLHQAGTALRNLLGKEVIEELPQTPGNCTLMGETLWSLVSHRNLVVYRDPGMRQQALNTVAVETSRGFRIAKEKAAKKIDSIAALSMACVAAAGSDATASYCKALRIDAPGGVRQLRTAPGSRGWLGMAGAVAVRTSGVPRPTKKRLGIDPRAR